MSLIDAVAVPITLTRYAPGGYVDGRWVDDDPTPSTIRAAVQPARPTELVNLPEGQRTRGAIKLYTNAPLLVADVETGQRADVVTYDGRGWVIHETAKYQGFGLLAYKAIAVLAPPAPEE